MERPKVEGFTDKTVEALPAPATGSKIYYDPTLRGFGVRVTAAGARSYIFNYRAKGRERRITVGSWPSWKVRPAREAAAALRRQVEAGGDPMAERHAERAAPTMAELVDRFEREHLIKRRPSTVRDYKSILTAYIRPKLGKLKVADVRHADVERLHSEIMATAPYRANRTVALLSKMFNLAVKWELLAENPARGIERAEEQRRERFLSEAEIARLVDALAGIRERDSANAIRLLLLTGARKAEVLGARWDQFDLTAGVWTKPAATTKQKREHRVPLSAPALALLVDMRAAADKAGDPSPWLFPGEGDSPLTDVKKSWARVCRAAGLGRWVNSKGEAVPEGTPEAEWQGNTRIHDLRHTYASILASRKLSLPIIGQLLGHTQTATTARYAHLFDDPLREATELVGAVVAPKSRQSAEVIPLTRQSGRKL